MLSDHAPAKAGGLEQEASSLRLFVHFQNEKVDSFSQPTLALLVRCPDEVGAVRGEVFGLRRRMLDDHAPAKAGGSEYRLRT